jgi:hypothetical protein
MRQSPCHFEVVGGMEALKNTFVVADVCETGLHKGSGQLNYRFAGAAVLLRLEEMTEASRCDKLSVPTKQS